MWGLKFEKKGDLLVGEVLDLIDAHLSEFRDVRDVQDVAGLHQHQDLIWVQQQRRLIFYSAHYLLHQTLLPKVTQLLGRNHRFFGAINPDFR